MVADQYEVVWSWRKDLCIVGSNIGDELLEGGTVRSLDWKKRLGNERDGRHGG